MLREMEAGDFDAIHAYASDPDVCQYMSFGPNSPEQTRAFIDRSLDARSMDARSDYNLLACLRDGTVVGGCGMHGAAGEAKAGYIGYLFRRDCWGMGYLLLVQDARCGQANERSEPVCDCQTDGPAATGHGARFPERFRRYATSGFGERGRAWLECIGISNGV